MKSVNDSTYTSNDATNNSDIEVLYVVANNVIGIITSFITTVLAITYIKYKQHKVKEDILIIERTIISFVYSAFIILLSLLLTTGQSNTVHMCAQYGFIVFISFILSNGLFTNIEMLIQIKRPFYVFHSYLLPKHKNVLWETLTVLIVAASVAFVYFIHQHSDLRISYLQMELQDLVVFIYQSVFSFINVVIVLYMCCFLCRNIPNKSRKALRNKLIYRLTTYVLYLTHSLLSLTVLLPEDQHQCISQLIVMLIMAVDFIFELQVIKQSDFFYYYFSREGTISACYHCLCGRSRSYTYPSKYKSKPKNEIRKDDALLRFHRELRLSNMSQLNIELSEYCLNLSLVGISLVFNNIMKTNNEFNKGNTMTHSNNSDANETVDPLLPNDVVHEKGLNYVKYVFSKDSFRDERNEKLTCYYNNIFMHYKKRNSITNTCSYYADSGEGKAAQGVNEREPQVEIRYYYYTELTHAISTQQINLSEIKNSLISHSTMTNFLICRNTTYKTFKGAKTFTVKTGNNLLTVEIFEDIISSSRANTIISKYLSYISSKSNTFLPQLLGVFWVHINSFSPFVIFVSTNTILENEPNELFNLWQLMHYSSATSRVEMISSSKDTTSICVTNENLFDDKTKIALKQYHKFTKTIKQDIAFLKVTSIC